VTQYVLRLDLSEHQHPGNQNAQHQTVCQLLRTAIQAIGSDMNRKGNLALSGNVHVGTWEFNEGDTAS
jgi:hypothetical protein